MSNGNQKGTKGLPKCIPKSIFGKGSELYWFWWVLWMVFGPFWELFSSKNDEQIDAKIDAEKVRNIMKNRYENGPEIDQKFDNLQKLVSRTNRVFRIRWMYKSHMIHAVEYVPARIRGKRRNSKTKNNSIKTYPKIGPKKASKKTWTCDQKCD